jgi:TatD DNase family protein
MARLSSAPATPVLAYAHGTGVYLNITSRCPTACTFCFKKSARWKFEGKDLLLRSREPSAREVLDAAEPLLATGRFKEIVFCGYGESTYRLGVMAAVGRETARRRPGLRRRLNTIGLGSLVWGRNIAPQLRRSLDAVSVSLNTADPAQWRRLHSPRPEFAEKGFDAVLEFVADCVRCGLETTVTAVDLPGVDLGAVERLALSLGARYRLRPPLSED